MESIWTIRQVRIKPEKLLYVLFVENKRLSLIIFSFKVPLRLGPEYWDIFDSEQFAGNSNLLIGVLTICSKFFELCLWPANSKVQVKRSFLGKREGVKKSVRS